MLQSVGAGPQRRSVLRLRVAAADHNQRLRCRAAAPSLPHLRGEDHTTLVFNCEFKYNMYSSIMNMFVFRDTSPAATELYLVLRY